MHYSARKTIQLFPFEDFGLQKNNQPDDRPSKYIKIRMIYYIYSDR